MANFMRLLKSIFLLTMDTATITTIANIAIALSVIVAFIFGIAQVNAAVRDRRDRLTLEVLRQFQSREFAELLYFITNHKMPETGAGLRSQPSADQIMMIQFGQQMESLGMIVAEGMIDLDLVDKTLGSFVTTTWEKYKPMFTSIREGKSPDPFLGEYFQWLAEAIAKNMEEKPRQPFHIAYSGGKLVKKRGPNHGHKRK
jgi:hypothetical protein